MNNNDNEQSEGMPDDLRRLLARAEQGEDGDPNSYNPMRTTRKKMMRKNSRRALAR